MTVTPTNSFHQSTNNPARLLIVEDNPDHYTLIQAACQRVIPDVELVWAVDADEALTYLETCVTTHLNLPRLLLLDLYLPDPDQAWALLQGIKRWESPYVLMPVVVFSHSDRREDILSFYQFGGTSYIVKPTDYELWLSYFQTVRQFWWDTATLPGGR